MNLVTSRRARARWLSTMLVPLALAGALVSAEPAEAAECTGPYAEHFEVSATVAKSAYGKGNVARLVVSVNRPVEAAGQRVATLPVEDALVIVVAQVGDVSFMGHSATTDADGMAAVRLPIRRYVEPGWADVTVSAMRAIPDVPRCLQVVEYGATEVERMFRVRR